jgi:hypothetical protein
MYTKHTRPFTCRLISPFGLPQKLGALASEELMQQLEDTVIPTRSGFSSKFPFLPNMNSSSQQQQKDRTRSLEALAFLLWEPYSLNNPALLKTRLSLLSSTHQVLTPEEQVQHAIYQDVHVVKRGFVENTAPTLNYQHHCSDL